VVGGLVSFGLIGIFIGPVVLAVSYTLLIAWINERAQGPGPDGTLNAAGGKEDDRRREIS
jgi:predicted PurR-regulated permease PerM